MSEQIVVFLDTETTGVGEFDRVVELALTCASPSTTWVRRFDPGIPIPPDVTDVHGISDADVAGLPPFAESIPEIRAMIDAATRIVGYNPEFDRKIVDGEFARVGEPLPRWPPLVDVKRLWDVYEPRERRNLTNAHKRFVRQEHLGAHGALEDCLATMRTLDALLAEFGLEGRDLLSLDPERATWWGDSHHVIWRGEELILNFAARAEAPGWWTSRRATGAGSPARTFRATC